MKRRADGRWQKKITLPNGKTKMLYSTASSERLATKDFNEQMLLIKQEAKDLLLFRNIAEEWSEEYQSRISEINYRKSTRGTFNAVADHFGAYYIQDITAQHIHKYINGLVKKCYSQKTISTHKSILNMIFTFAILNGVIDNNPVQVITLPSNLPKKSRKLPSDEELKKINSNYEGFAFLPYFLLNTGLRKSEALALTYEDIDFENKTVLINKHLIHDNNNPKLEYKTKTENSERTVILLDRVIDKMPKNKKGIIFCNEQKGYLTKKQYEIKWRKWQKENDTTITAHQLRHGFATMLFEAGIDIKDAQELMGHSDITTTHSIYTHIRNKRKEETAKKLNEFSF